MAMIVSPLARKLASPLTGSSFQDLRYFQNVPFFTGDGETSQAQLVDGKGNPISSDKLRRIDAIHQTDWQGRIALSNQPRTNVAPNSNDLSAATWITSGTVIPHAGAGPDGGKLWEIITGGYTYEYDLVAADGSTNYVASWWYQDIADGAAYAVYDQTNSKFIIPQTNYPGASGIVSVPFATAATTANIRLYVARPSEHLSVANLQIEKGSSRGNYIPTEDAPVTVTDYTANGSEITFGQPPAKGAILTWSGVASR